MGLKSEAVSAVESVGRSVLVLELEPLQVLELEPELVGKLPSVLELEPELVAKLPSVPGLEPELVVKPPLVPELVLELVAKPPSEPELVSELVPKLPLVPRLQLESMRSISVSQDRLFAHFGSRNFGTRLDIRKWILVHLGFTY